MTEPLGLILAAVAAGVTGWLLGRRYQPGRLRDGVAPHLLPDPALEWLRRAHRAVGVWITELDPGEEGPKAERIIEPERLSVAQIVAVDRRLERARDQEQSGVERLEGGMLVFHAQAGAAVGLLLPEGSRHGGARRWSRMICAGCSKGSAAGPRSSRSPRRSRRKRRSNRSGASASGWPISWSARSMPRSSWPRWTPAASG